MVRGRAKVIPYATVKQIIDECKDKRTKALIAFQYAMGARVGELARKYKHIKTKKRKGTGKIDKTSSFETEGLRRDQFTETATELNWESPNFKNKKHTLKKAWILKESESWLYDILIDWLKFREGRKFLFNLGESRIRHVVGLKLKEYNSDWHSHCLRHSRATHIAEVSENVFTVKEILGHARVETSQRYISLARGVLKRSMAGRTFESVLGKKV